MPKQHDSRVIPFPSHRRVEKKGSTVPKPKITRHSWFKEFKEDYKEYVRLTREFRSKRVYW